ncbi:MAG: hypothetical protein MK082_01435 [Phycisphaerales bacterium]|nr:hypothetical protein [Phycisphaerales bacterium]
MMLNGKSRTILVLVCACLGTSGAQGEIEGEFEVGEGDLTSTIEFQFTNQNQYVYTLRHDGGLTGRDAFDIIESAQPDFFTPIIYSYDFGDFLFGLGIGSDSDEGFGTAPEYLDYWHYWTMEAGDDDWTNSMIGFSDRILLDGSSDGWVFNSNDAPIPAPATFLVALGAGLARRRRS